MPDELWELFQRVVPEAPTRPQGGGRRRHGDREALAAIVRRVDEGQGLGRAPPVLCGVVSEGGLYVTGPPAEVVDPTTRTPGSKGRKTERSERPAQAADA